MSIEVTSVYMLQHNTNTIKLCLWKAQTNTLQQFCDGNLEINYMILKLEGDLDIVMMYPHTENAFKTQLELKKAKLAVVALTSNP